jgi:hypothetical protein
LSLEEAALALRIVSWNMAGRRENWIGLRALLGDGPAVGLVQEAVDPAGSDSVAGLSIVPGGAETGPWSTPDGKPRRWATAVVATADVACTPAHRVALRDATGEELSISHPGSYAAAEVSVGGAAAMGVVSLYGIWQRQAAVGIYAEATLHRTISDLSAWLQRPPLGGLVLAGDFNCYLDYGDWWDERYMTVFNRLGAYGLQLLGPQGTSPLEGCPCRLGEQCRHVRTYAHQGKVDGKPFQLDFVFADPIAAARSSACAVDPTAAFGASDHLPVVTTLATSDTLA